MISSFPGWSTDSSAWSDRPHWLRVFGHIGDGEAPVTVLEVGCFEGGGTRFINDHFLKHPESKIHCVDIWRPLEKVFYGDYEYESVFDTNTKHFADKMVKYRGSSVDVLPTLPSETFDMVYVDGNHAARFVVRDGLEAVRLAKVGGFVVFDDYAWKQAPKLQDRPKLAVDFLIDALADFVRVRFVGYQCILEKTQSLDS